MSKNPPIRNYNFTDADLKQRVDSLILSITRDITDFNKRGVITATLDALAAENEAFADLPTDEELLGQKTTATENKDAAATVLKAQIRAIRGMADDKFNGKGIYRSFGFEGMDEMTDNDLHRLGKRVFRVGTALQAAMQPNGLTAEVLTALKDATASFDNLIDVQDDAIKTRDIAAETRINAGNELFAEFSRLCNIGKSLYQDTDEAKYNDYVIDSSPATPPTPPPPTN